MAIDCSPITSSAATVANGAGTMNPGWEPPGAAYQLLATSLGAVRPAGGVLLTATAVPSTVAAETVARLAVAAAREGRRILVIDANLRDRRLSRLFGFEHAVGGLTELLAGLASIDDVRRTVGVGGEATLASSPADDPSTTPQGCSLAGCPCHPPHASRPVPVGARRRATNLGRC